MGQKTFIWDRAESLVRKIRLMEDRKDSYGK